LYVALLFGPGNRHRASLEATAHQEMTVDMELSFMPPVVEVPQPAGELLTATLHDEQWLGPRKEIGVLAA
jgi:hypothetical protein